MALFFLVGHAGAAGLSATPNPIQWAVDQDPDSQQIEIENTGPQEQTCQLLLSNVTGGKGGAVVGALRLKSEPAEITLAARQKRTVKLKLKGGLQCPAGLYQATLTLKPQFGAGAETKVPIQVRVPARLIVAVEAASPDVERRPQGFDALARFYVEASTPNVQLFVVASPLIYQNEARGQKAPNASPTPKIPPIPLDLGRGVQIIPQNSGPGGAPPRAYFRSERETVGPFPMQTTEGVVLSAGNAPFFAQTVFVTVHWKLADSRQPVGTYIGRVQLCGMVMPE
jgi:hypothetical protein